MRDKIIKMSKGILKVWGLKAVRKMIWNREFSSGRWDSLTNTDDDPIYFYIKKYAHNGSILDLGCGSGNTGNEIDEFIYEHYIGVDLSENAIREAIARSKANNRAVKNKYFCDDIITYKPEKLFNIILFRESIYYLPKFKIKSVLRKYAQKLAPDGVFIIRIYNAETHGGDIIKLIEAEYTVLEKYLIDDTKGAIVVFH